MLIKVGDTVQLMTGDDSHGKLRGKVIKVDVKKNKVLVEGANRVYKHVKPSQKNPQGGRLSKEMPVSVSNVKIIDPRSSEPTRIGVRYLDDGTKERYAKKSGASLGEISPPKPAYAKK